MTIPRAPAVPANTNPTHPTKQSPAIHGLKRESRRRRRRAGVGVRGQQKRLGESLNRTEEGHTGAMAIPKTTYLLSHNDSACQNKCQDTARNWLTLARRIGRPESTSSPQNLFFFFFLTYAGSRGEPASTYKTWSLSDIMSNIKMDGEAENPFSLV